MKLSRKFSPDQAAARLDRVFEKISTRATPKPTLVRVHSSKLGLDYTYPRGSSDRPYHTASIGKMFTAVLVQRLAERGALSLEDPLHCFIPQAELEGLYVFQGKDYSRDVKITHLLGHTSGIADYFEGPTTGGKTLVADLLENPDRRWTPQALLDFTRHNQRPVGAPGQKFNYSDSGYILLGLLVERVTGKSLAASLIDEIFAPLEMRDSYLMFAGEPANPARPIEKIWFDRHEISGYTSLSCDWAGGGIVSTTADLLKFNQALRGGRLVSPAALAAMDHCPHRFQPGIYYGLGMMEIRFKEFFFLLGGLPRVHGHIGILSTHLFYDPAAEAHIVLNFGSNRRMVESFQALIQIENTLQRLG